MGEIRQTLVMVAVMAAVVCATGLAPGKTYYIAPNGSERSEGTETSPFGTFDHAIDLAGPGDTIYVAGGLYSLSSSIRIDKAGEKANRIKLHATIYNNGKGGALQVRLRDGHPHTIKIGPARRDSQVPGWKPKEKREVGRPGERPYQGGGSIRFSLIGTSSPRSSFLQIPFGRGQ